jgi:hypothetical protein
VWIFYENCGESGREWWKIACLLLQYCGASENEEVCVSVRERRGGWLKKRKKKQGEERGLGGRCYQKQ